jgi:general stress protein 26
MGTGEIRARRWSEVAVEAPELAEAGRELLYQYGPGLGMLATVRKDGGPRLHPVCPVVTHGGLWVFVVNRSPKVHDLRRDGRYALHALGPEDRDDEFMVAGPARVVDDPAVEADVLEVYLAQGTTSEDHTLFELLVERALHVPYGPRPSPPLRYERWQAG